MHYYPPLQDDPAAPEASDETWGKHARIVHDAAAQRCQDEADDDGT